MESVFLINDLGKAAQEKAFPFDPAAITYAKGCLIGRLPNATHNGKSSIVFGGRRPSGEFLAVEFTLAMAHFAVVAMQAYETSQETKST